MSKLEWFCIALKNSINCNDPCYSPDAENVVRSPASQKDPDQGHRDLDGVQLCFADHAGIRAAYHDRRRQRRRLPATGYGRRFRVRFGNPKPSGLNGTRACHRRCCSRHGFRNGRFGRAVASQ